MLNNNYEEKALTFFEKSHNCSQSVLAAFSNSFGVSDHQALSIASGFGAGMCFQKQICGAVTGAYMVLGLQSGSRFNEGESIKENTYQLVRVFNKEFEKLYKTTNCNKLLGVDISTPEGIEKAIETGVFKSKCPEFVRGAVQICNAIITK